MDVRSQVYLGAPDTGRLPSIDGTRRPWFINVLDFDSPNALAAYMQHVASNETLWQSYLGWQQRFLQHGRSSLFPDAQAPIRELLEPKADLAWLNTEHSLPNGLVPHRAAAVCRLCDRKYVADLAKTNPLLPRDPPWSEEKWRPRLLGQS